jgi:nondiscriminating aspartyl-tRNA synthetase
LSASIEVGPVFRAEPHDTIRHVNEYVSLDVEFGFIDNHFTVMGLLREVLAGIFDHLAERCAAELALLEARLPVARPRFLTSTLPTRKS